MRITTQNEGPHPHIHVDAQLRQHLLRITHDRTAAAAASQSDAGPQTGFQIQVTTRRSPQLVLPPHSRTLAVLRSIPDLLPPRTIQFRNQPIGRRPRLSLRLTHNHMNPQSKIHHPTMLSRLPTQTLHRFPQLTFRLRPHQIHITVLRTQRLRCR